MALKSVEGETWVFAESAYDAEKGAPVRSLAGACGIGDRGIAP